MFFEKKLATTILNSANDNIELFENGIKKIVEKYDGNINDITESEFFLIRKQYLNKVYNSVKDSYKKEPKLYDRIIEIENNPDIIGYDINLASGFLGGTIYAIIYYAKKRRLANPRDCVELNHATNDFIQKVIDEAESA